MSKKFLILGAGNAQVDLINYLNENGVETHGCSYTDTDNGIVLLSHFEQINIIDVEAVENYCVKNNIDYVYSVGSDIAVPTFSKVSENLGKFSFVSSQTAQICCNKHLMREKMGNSPFNIEFLVCETKDDLQKVDFFPVMIKPVDSQGQRGVFLAKDRDMLLELFEKSIAFSKCKKVIVEKYVGGDEVSVNAYVKDKKVIFSILSDRESFKNLPGGIIKAHHLPSVYENTKTAEEISQLVNETVKKLEINNGPVYFQIKVCNFKPYLIEVTPRLDGCHMHKLIKSYCGVDLLSLTVKHIFGENIEIGEYECSKYPMHLEFFCEPTNTPFSAEKYNDCFCDFSFFYYKTGDKIRKLNGYMEKCGYRIYKTLKKIGVIGASGFIGKNLLEQYGNQYEFINISRSNGCVSDYSEKELTKALCGCDSVIILASKKVSQNEEQSLSLYIDNVNVLENTLIACKNLGIKNIVYTSSRCVYKNDQCSPIKETALIEPINYYGISKATAEQLCVYYNNKYGFNIKILRLAQIIGNDKNGYMIDKFVNSAIKGEPLTVYGNAVGKRDYIYIKDVINALILSLIHSENCGIYNIGSGTGTTSKHLADAVIKGFESKSEIIMLCDKEEDTSISYLDVTKAEKELSFRCEYSLLQAFEDLKNTMMKV